MMILIMMMTMMIQIEWLVYNR